MPNTRISETASKILNELSEKTGESRQALLNKALEAYRRKCFLEEANTAFRALREDPEAWQAEQDERDAWDITSNDDEMED